MTWLKPTGIAALIASMCMAISCQNDEVAGREWAYYGTEQGLGGATVNRIWVDSSTEVWFATTGGLSCLLGDQITNQNSQDGLPSDEIWAVCRANDGALWIGTPKGAAKKYEGGGWIVLGIESGLPSEKIYAIYPDVAGGVWLATDAGISHYVGGQFVNYGASEGMPTNQFWDVYVASNGDVWAGSDAGAVKIAASGGLPSVYRTQQGLISDTVYSVFEYNGIVWFGTDSGVTCMVGDQMCSYTTEQGLPSDLIYDITADNAGHLWIATGGGGVSEFYDNTFHNLTLETSNYVLSVASNSMNSKWFGTLGGGVVWLADPMH